MHGSKTSQTSLKIKIWIGQIGFDFFMSYNVKQVYVHKLVFSGTLDFYYKQLRILSRTRVA